MFLSATMSLRVNFNHTLCRDANCCKATYPWSGGGKVWFQKVKTPAHSVYWLNLCTQHRQYKLAGFLVESADLSEWLEEQICGETLTFCADCFSISAIGRRSPTPLYPTWLHPSLTSPRRSHMWFSQPSSGGASGMKSQSAPEASADTRARYLWHTTTRPAFPFSFTLIVWATMPATVFTHKNKHYIWLGLELEVSVTKYT